MYKLPIMLMCSLLLLSAAVFESAAGINSCAKASITCFRNNRIGSSLQIVELGDTCVIAIRIEGVVSLNSYSIEITYDSTVVSFCGSAVKKTAFEKPFIESTGGEIISLVNGTKDGAELAVALKGKGVSVSGNGNLGYFVLRCVKTGNPCIQMKEIKLVDSSSQFDVIHW